MRTEQFLEVCRRMMRMNGADGMHLSRELKLKVRVHCSSVRRWLHSALLYHTCGVQKKLMKFRIISPLLF